MPYIHYEPIVDQTNTPIPTATPYPTWDWATPTPFPTMLPSDPRRIDAFDFTVAVRDGSQYAVGVWQTANTNGAMDIVQGLLMFIIVLRLSRRILQDWKNL